MVYKVLETIKRRVLFLYGAIAGSKSYLPALESLSVIIADRVKFYADTPNTIIRFESATGNGFFRECRKHTTPKEFLDLLFEDYCTYVFVNDNSCACLGILRSFLAVSDKWKLFYRMGEGTAEFSRITKFRQTKNHRFLGFDDGLPGWFYDQLLQLVQFAWGPLMEYRYCRLLPIGYYQTFNSAKSIVTRKVAEFFGESQLIPRTYYAKLVFDGRERVGVVVDPASGIDPTLLEEKLSLDTLSPMLQKNLISLWLMDILCFQKDHRPGNYFISKGTDGKYSGVSAFDNDCPTTLFPSPIILFPTYTGIPPLFTKSGICRLPFMSKNLVNRMMDSKESDILSFVGSVCSKIELIMLLKRLHSLNKIIRANVISKNVELIEDNDWSEDTFSQELSLSQKTYLTYLISKNCSLS